MSQLVGGFCLPHDPLITGLPDAAEPEIAKRVMGGFSSVKSRLQQLNVDTVIVIGDDHCAMFHPSCQPRLLLGIGHLEGPLEPEHWLKIPRRVVPNNTPLAEHLMKVGFERGFDWAISKTLVLDHSTMVPIHLAVPAGVRAVPVYISCGMEPIISGQRCKQLGQMLGEAVRSWGGNGRVAILGTGGISHWVGMARNGEVNEEFDRRILAMVESGDIDGLVALTDDEVVEQAGNGALEIRNWIVAMSAMPDFKASVMAYEPVPPWITGLGFAELAVLA